MPVSIDPQPAENEFECANCGAYFHYELTRCPNCGVNLYEPEIDVKKSGDKKGLVAWFKDAYHRLFRKPYAASDVFGDALDASILYNDLLNKSGGDRAVADRLIEYEQVRTPKSTRKVWIENAIQRWMSDNQGTRKI